MTDAAPLSSPPDDGAERAERVEHCWAAVSVAVLVLFVAVATFAALHLAAMPQSRVETADPITLHLDGEFIDSNLGSALEPDGSVTVRGIGQQYSFTPSCMLVPADTAITFRATSCRCSARLPRHGDQHQFDARAGLHLEPRCAF
jgi:cytochrome c oxidase subunit II